MDGVLIVDKPAGMTSHDVVARVRAKLGTRKVGHGGTLDPDATGVLVIGIGKATRLLSYSQAARKRYRAVATLGVTTVSQDASGEVVDRRAVNVSLDELTQAASEFVGTIQQVPPMVSAVKVGGERLYKKAQRGEEIERTARAVNIYKLEILEFSGAEGPGTDVILDVTCSGGTYVRTLVHDIGVRLGCGAHLRRLRRVESGGFAERDAVGLDAVDRSKLRPLLEAVKDLQRVDVDERMARLVADGRPLEVAALVGSGQDYSPEGAPIAVVRNERLLAVYRREGTALVADRVIPQ